MATLKKKQTRALCGHESKTAEEMERNSVRQHERAPLRRSVLIKSELILQTAIQVVYLCHGLDQTFQRGDGSVTALAEQQGRGAELAGSFCRSS